MTNTSIPISVLDLSPIPDGSTASHALANTLALAQKAEHLGFHRYWLAEHHNMPGIASAATSVVIGHVAAGTNKIRVGSGGIMLPNHSPLVIAEQFGTLAALHPDRIDLGLGRAPGSDPLTARALRRDLNSNADQFPNDVMELQAYFADASQTGKVRAIPGAGLDVPIWILGSSLYGAQLAAALGLPFAFASHFAPTHLEEALQIYRASFRPSDKLKEPYAMLTVNAVAADTAEEALFHFTSQQQSFVNLRRGMPGKIPTPDKDFTKGISASEQLMLDQALRCSFIGDAKNVTGGLVDFIDVLKPDELMITAHIHSQIARLRSLELLADVLQMRTS